MHKNVYDSVELGKFTNWTFDDLLDDWIPLTLHKSVESFVDSSPTAFTISSLARVISCLVVGVRLKGDAVS